VVVIVIAIVVVLVLVVVVMIMETRREGGREGGLPLPLLLLTDRKAVVFVTQTFHQFDVFFITMVVITGDFPIVTIFDMVGGFGEFVPNAGTTTIFLCCTWRRRRRGGGRRMEERGGGREGGREERGLVFALG